MENSYFLAEIKHAAYMHLKSHEAATVEIMNEINREKYAYMHDIAERYNKSYSDVLKEVDAVWEPMWEEKCKINKARKERADREKIIKELKN